MPDRICLKPRDIQFNRLCNNFISFHLQFYFSRPGRVWNWRKIHVDRTVTDVFHVKSPCKIDYDFWCQNFDINCYWVSKRNQSITTSYFDGKFDGSLISSISHQKVLMELFYTVVWHFVAQLPEFRVILRPETAPWNFAKRYARVTDAKHYTARWHWPSWVFFPIIVVIMFMEITGLWRARWLKLVQILP